MKRARFVRCWVSGRCVSSGWRNFWDGHLRCLSHPEKSGKVLTNLTCCIQLSERRHLCAIQSKDTIQAPIQRCRRLSRSRTPSWYWQVLKLETLYVYVYVLAISSHLMFIRPFIALTWPWGHSALIWKIDTTSLRAKVTRSRRTIEEPCWCWSVDVLDSKRQTVNIVGRKKI